MKINSTRQPSERDGKQGELSSARLAFRGERRNPALPIIPQSGGEEEQGRRKKEEKDKRRNQLNARRSKRVKKPPILVPGQRIMTSKYSTSNEDTDKVLPGKVLRIRPITQERSAVIELDNGKTTIRNRKMCVLDTSQPQPDTVNNVEECDSNTCIKLIAKKEKNNDEIS